MEFRNANIAVKEMLFDLTHQILKLADKPAMTNEKVANQLRELTGASIVAIYSQDENGSLSLNYINPTRKKDSPQIGQYLQLAHETSSGNSIIRFDSPEHKALENKSDEENSTSYSFGIPLNYGPKSIGAILVIDLPTNHGIQLVEDALSNMASVLDLVLRNAFLYETQQKQLNQSVAHIESLVNSRDESIWSIDTNFRFLTINSFFKESFITAYNTSISVGSDAIGILPEEMKIFWKPKYEKALSGEKLSFEFQETVEGVKIFFEVHLAPIIIDDKIIGCSAIANDISDRVAAVENLQISESRFRSIFDNVGHGVGLVELNGKYIQVNEGFSRITGYSTRELSQMTNKDLIHPEDFETTREQIQKIISGEKLFFNEKKRLIHKTGKIIWVSINVNSIYSTEGKLEFLTGIMHDISSEVETNRSLEESELKYRQLADHTFDWEYWIGPDGKYIYVSPSCERICGYSAENFYENPQLFIDLAHKECKENVVKHFTSESSEGESLENMDFKILHKDGREIWISHTCSAIYDKDGNYLGRRGVNRDISERKKMVDDLVSSKEKAEESDKLKSAFLANVSHEIRTPMNGILGFSSLLKNSDLSQEKQKSYIDIIEKSGGRMLDTINDIIDISKIESGQEELYIAETKIEDSLDYIYAFFLPEAKAKGLILINNSPKGENVCIDTDKKKLQDIIINLIKNAIKYTNSGTIEFSYQIKADALEFYVKDTGIGIAKERQAAVFERFVQADLSLTRPYEGAGLGLSICQAYVKLLGGKIWLESEFGKGSAFYFSIPYMQTQSSVALDVEESKKPKEELNNLKVLIAEDEDTSFELLEIIIEDKCSEIIRAKNGIEAVDLFKDNKDVDLIFMDIRMPDMNGYEATKKIREINQEVKIIAQTAFALEGDRKLALQAGCNDYISKPLIGPRVLELMGKILSE